MESPVAIVKNSFNPGRLLGFLGLAIVAFALADISGLTNWIIWPVSTAKAKFAKKA